MYNITELVITLCLVYAIYKSEEIVNEVIKRFPKKTFFDLLDFYQFVCDNNILLDYDSESGSESDSESNSESEGQEKKQIKEEKYEDKYLEKFNQFSNDYYFNELEIEEENKEFEKLKITLDTNKFKNINSLQEQLFEINEIQTKGNISIDKNDSGFFTKDINEFGINALLTFFDLISDYEDDPDDIDFEKLYEELLTKKVEIENELKKEETTSITCEEIRSKAHESIVNIKLDNLINNYVLEHTPLGNVYMRYNNSKKSFEYFSNNTIPYRYLESVSRKYVMTYLCKPLFVNIEEELKKAEIKFEEDKKKREEDEKQKQEEMKNGSKDVIARLKSYNKDTINQNKLRPQMKNRVNNVLPPQIKANLANVNQPSEKQLLKENANRYTWEGRLTDFCPLKKIDKKILDKKLAMTYSDFKRIQLNQTK